MRSCRHELTVKPTTRKHHPHRPTIQHPAGRLNWSVMSSRFQNVYLFHGRGEAPGNPLTLEEMLWARFPRVNYIRPLLRHIDPTVTAKDSFKSASHKTFMIEPKSLIIGFGMGGLIAAALQERFPLHELSVFAISSPTHMTTLTLTKRIEDRREIGRAHV